MTSRRHNDNSHTSNLLQHSSIITDNESVCCDFIEELNGTESDVKNEDNGDILFIEPFYSGSHKQLIDLLHKSFPKSKLITLSGKKWPWRARCSALILSTIIPEVTNEKVLFCSSVLSLSELLGLRQDLQKLRKIVYFHENQFIYPIREIKERDVQFAYNQITTCLSADEIIFNSEYNLNSLLDNLNKIIKLLPDYRPKGLVDKIQPKCKVIYFPVEFPKVSTRRTRNHDILNIVWPHRWEFDKSPEAFIEILKRLKGKGCNFHVHMLGGNFNDVPDVVVKAKEYLKDNIMTMGFVDSKEGYYDILCNSDVVVSTAIHEFFGVSMLEATFCGCFPIVPNKLVYPEIYPKQCLYDNDDQCLEMLMEFCKNPKKASMDREQLHIDFEKYSNAGLKDKYDKLFHWK